MAIYLTKELIEYKFEDLPIYNELKFDKEDYTFQIGNDQYSIYPLDHNGWLKTMDQIIMTGHYLYGKNHDFRTAYRELYEGKEFNINYRKIEDVKPFFVQDLFHIFLYGIIAAEYIKSLPATPIHYFARPIADERNDALVAVVTEERKIDKKYRRMDGTPYYNYLLKKSAVMPNNATGSANVLPSIICPISRIIPEMKQTVENLNILASYIFKDAITNGEPGIKAFAKTFIDESWSPFLKAL